MGTSLRRIKTTPTIYPLQRLIDHLNGARQKGGSDQAGIKP